MEKQNVVYPYTMGYRATLKRKESVTHATTWMNLEDITLNKINQSYTKNRILYDSTYMRSLEKSNS